MLDLLAFVYSGSAPTAVLTIGAGVGAVAGAVIGAVILIQYLRRKMLYTRSVLSVPRSFVYYAAVSTAVTIIAAAGMTAGAVIGACGLIAIWFVWPFALIGGAIGSVIYAMRRREMSGKMPQVSSEPTTLIKSK